MNCTGQIQL